MNEQQQQPTHIRPTSNTSDNDDDDDIPTLSPYALEALKLFLSEQYPQEQEETTQNDNATAGGDRESDTTVSVSLLSEDWRLSQFWYSPETAQTVADEVNSLLGNNLSGSGSGSVVCIACPTLFVYLKKMYPNVSAQLLEYDKRFQQYGSDFTFYDYNLPEDLPQAMKHSYQIVVVDPPYLSEECLEKVSQTIAFLAQPEKYFVLLLTGEVQRDKAAKLLGLHPCGFRPQHTSKLGNEFRLFTNYDPGERLGGWDLEE